MSDSDHETTTEQPAPTWGEIDRLIPAAMAAIDSVAKTKQKDSGVKFAFRKVDDVVNAVRTPFADHGIGLSFEVINVDRSREGKMVSTVLQIRYTLTAPDGSSRSSVVIGEGQDSYGGFSSNKAMSAALKYFLCHALLIPTNDQRDDQEHQGNGRQELGAAKQDFLLWVKRWRDEAGVTPDSPADLAWIRNVVRDLIGKDTVSTFDELNRVSNAIEAGQYDPHTAERVPEGI